MNATSRSDGVSPEAAPLRHGTTSFEAFYRREFPRMVSLAYAICGSGLQAEDVAQESLIEAGRRWDKLANFDKPGAWLRRVTIQKAGRRRARTRTEVDAWTELGAAQRHESNLEPGSPEHEAVLDAVRTLPLRQRAAVALYYLEDRSIEEVAAVMQCSPGTVKAHLHKARRSLARVIETEER